MKFDLGWGNSVCVREAFVNTYHKNPIIFSPQELLKFDYPNHEGDPDLVNLTREVIKRQTGHDYKHILMTNGATGGVVIALRAFQQQGHTMCLTRKAPFYVRYPRMIKASGLKHIQDKKDGWEDILEVHLIDLPSNPLGLVEDIYPDYHESKVIVDGVYYNNVYMAFRPLSVMPHDVMVGSYSKLLGINGIRVGWLATNDDLLFERFRDLVTSEYCGLSTASTDILKHTLQGFDWEKFEFAARWRLDYNREQFSKLERFFGRTPIPFNGMFYYAPIDSKAKELLGKAGVTYTAGSAMGTTDDFGRFNLGQDNRLTEEAVRAILKADKIKG